MDVEQQIFGLMAAAQEQQKAAEAATRELEGKLRELNNLLNQLPKVLNKWHDDLDGMVSAATKETLKKEIVGDMKSLKHSLEQSIERARLAANTAFWSAISVLAGGIFMMWNHL